MAKITRKHQKIFAETGPSGATGPSGVLGKFGSYAAGSPSYSDDPDLLQTSAFGYGLSSALINSAPPAIQDIDGLCYLLARQTAYLFQAGIPEYNASTIYFIGGLASDGAGSIYISVVDNNVNFALSNTDKWTLYKSRNVRSAGSDFVTLNSDDYTVLCTGAGGSSPTYFVLPAPKAVMKGRIAIVKNLHDTFDLNISAEGGATIDGSSSITLTNQYQVKKLICNGTNWESI